MQVSNRSVPHHTHYRRSKWILQQVNDRIWITMKARMEAEHRNLRYDSIVHTSISIFALAVVLVNIFEEALQDTTAYLSQFQLSLSVIVLVIALVLSGYNFKSKAQSYRQCYQELQWLYNNQPSDLTKRYSEIIRYFPNHEPIDHENLIASRWVKFRERVRKPIDTDKLQPQEEYYSVTNLIIARYYFRNIVMNNYFISLVILSVLILVIVGLSGA